MEKFEQMIEGFCKSKKVEEKILTNPFDHILQANINWPMEEDFEKFKLPRSAIEEIRNGRRYSENYDEVLLIKSGDFVGSINLRNKKLNCVQTIGGLDGYKELFEVKDGSTIVLRRRLPRASSM